MLNRDTQNLLGGALLLAFGLAYALYAIANYPVGTPARMQPGMFPAIVGFLLAGFGAALAVPAMFRPGVLRVARAPGTATPTGTATPIATVACILVGIVGFGLVIITFGMVPAVYVLTLVATIPDRRLSLVGKILLATAISGLVVVIFRFGLGLHVPLVKWPF